ncbi:MAG: hypothetical protein K2H22_08695 [Muribaculaceae bacterium]|nr:hypothetical protein [Muribaculaceae bacterium]
MRYDDDRYFDDEEDNDLWDDELELTSDDGRQERDGMSGYHSASDSSYSPYDAGYAEPQDDNRHEVYSEDKAQKSYQEEPDDYYSDPEPKAPVKSRRERFFGKKAEEEEDDNDYFDSHTEPVPAHQKPKTPKLDPEDPDYWIEEEDSPLSDIIPNPGKKWKWWLTAVITLLCAITFVWIWFLRPYTDNAVKYGYLKNMERRGSIIKTFEGSMIPYKELGDPNPFYFEEVRFSVRSDSLAAVLKRMMLGCVPVRVEYEVYHAPLPWIGEEKMIITKADTADPRKILPPEYR